MHADINTTVRNHDVQAFITARLKAGASNSEINRELTVLKRAFNLGLQNELVTRKPVIRMLKVETITQIRRVSIARNAVAPPSFCQ
jgi:site-specific recombinase XerD